MNFQYTAEEAELLDARFNCSARNEFYIPEIEGNKVIYFCGNSLGLQPVKVKEYLDFELNQWKNLGVEGHFTGNKPWMYYHHFSKKSIAKLVNALEDEVVMMGSLSANLHFLLVSFYQPTSKRFKIMTEAGAFSSDQYILESQARFHGFNPEEAIIEIAPREGEFTLRTEDIISVIHQNKEELALVLMGGVNYFTGQLFDIQLITNEAQKIGAKVGFDLAHAIGNVPLQLHDWNVDFAAWCSYKYLNAGPGGVGGIFVHQNHHQSNLPRFAAWWGYKEKERFQMKSGFKPSVGADSWQLSNAPILNLATLSSSLEVFDNQNLDLLFAKTKQMNDYLRALLLNSTFKNNLTIITPVQEFGAQLSLVFKENAKTIFQKLSENHVIADWREPNVIRVAPVGLYNTFKEIFDFVQILEKIHMEI